MWIQYYYFILSARINDATFDEEQGGDNIIFDDVDDDDEDIDDVSLIICVPLYNITWLFL